jgi:hypothetical protein
MAANMTETRIEETIGKGMEERRGQGGGPRIARYGLVVAALVAVVLLGVAIHGRGVSHPAGSVTPRAETSEGIRFVEENTITLPSVGASAAVSPGTEAAHQRFLEENTIILPSVGGAEMRTPMMSEQQRFIEENTITLPEVSTSSDFREQQVAEFDALTSRQTAPAR